MGRKFDVHLLGILQHFEATTHAKAIDVVEHEGLWFVVETIHVGKAIGKGGSNIKRLQHAFQKRVHILAYDPDPVIFVQNLLYPLKPSSVVRKNDTLLIEDPSAQLKGRIIGRGAENLHWLNSLFQRHFSGLSIVVK